MGEGPDTFPALADDSLSEPVRHGGDLRNFESIRRACSVSVALKVKVFQHFSHHFVQLCQQLQLVHRHFREGQKLVERGRVALNRGCCSARERTTRRRGGAGKPDSMLQCGLEFVHVLFLRVDFGPVSILQRHWSATPAQERTLECSRVGASSLATRAASAERASSSESGADPVADSPHWSTS